MSKDVDSIRIHFNSRNVRIGANRNDGTGILSRALTGVDLHNITHTDIATHRIFRERGKDDEEILPLKRYEVCEGEKFYTAALKINGA